MVNVAQAAVHPSSKHSPAGEGFPPSPLSMVFTLISPWRLWLYTRIFLHPAAAAAEAAITTLAVVLAVATDITFIPMQTINNRMYVCMYLCVSVCMYVCMYVCVYVCGCVCMYASMSVCLYVYVYVCMYVFMYVCMCVCMSVCIYVFMFVCMYVRMYVRMCVFMCVYVGM